MTGTEGATIGHNLPPFDFFNFFDVVVNTMGMTSAEKLMQIIIARRSHACGGKAVAPARAELARQASCSEATMKRSYKMLEAFFEVNPRSGKTTEYTPRSIVTLSDVEMAIRGLSPAKGAHGEPPTPALSEPGAHGEPGSQGAGAHGARVMVSPLGHGEPPTQGHGEPGHKKEIPPTPPKEKNNIYKQLPPQYGATQSGGEILGLNGATSLIVNKLAGWINPMMPDHRTARASVENFVGLYGSDVVRDAFAKLEAKNLHGDLVARPIPYLASECARLKVGKDKPKKPARQPRPWD